MSKKKETSRTAQACPWYSRCSVAIAILAAITLGALTSSCSGGDSMKKVAADIVAVDEVAAIEASPDHAVDVAESDTDAQNEPVQAAVSAPPVSPAAEVPATETPEDSVKVYTLDMVDQKPEFPGGEQAMFKWLGEHIKYPPACEPMVGRLVVSFDIDKDGSVSNVRLTSSDCNYLLDREALRLVKSMPHWIPARFNGQPVKVTYDLPITFKMQD